MGLIAVDFARKSFLSDNDYYENDNDDQEVPSDDFFRYGFGSFEDDDLFSDDDDERCYLPCTETRYQIDVTPLHHLSKFIKFFFFLE